MDYRYTFTYFSKFHFTLMLYALILFTVFYYIHININESKLSLYATVLGIVVLLLKLFDSINLHIMEKKNIVVLLPLHICNLALICGAIYLITKKQIFFNILYFFSFGVIPALIVPDWTSYNSIYYPYLYYTTHILELIILVFGFKKMKVNITKKHFYEVCIVLLILFVTAYFVNYNFKDMNFMFLNDYAVKFLTFIKPFWLYRVLVIFVYYFFTYLMYLIIKNKKRGENYEENVCTKRI